MLSKTKILANNAIVAESNRIAPALLALMIGAFMIVGVGFAQSGTVHNVAHDARHAFAFPCH